MSTWRTDFTGATHAEVAAAVSEVLEAHGISAVMSGGGCVSIYAENKYYSDDLDFIDVERDSSVKIREALSAIDFHRGEDRYFRNRTTGIYVEFPKGPVRIGNEDAKPPVEYETPQGKIRMLSPTDCVKDRLAQFYAWDDAKGLYQALIVAIAKPIILSEVKRWSLQSEGEKEKFGLFLKLYEKGRGMWDFTEDDIIQAATDWKVTQRIKRNKGKGGYGY